MDPPLYLARFLAHKQCLTGASTWKKYTWRLGRFFEEILESQLMPLSLTAFITIIWVLVFLLTGLKFLEGWYFFHVLAYKKLFEAQWRK